MKTKSLLLATVAASLASSIAFGAVSSNIVGYTKLNLSAGYTLIANTLNAADNHYHVLFGTLPNNTTVLTWNGASFDSDNLFDNTLGSSGWTGNDYPLNPGQAVFIQEDAATSTYLVGSVQPTGSLTIKGNNAYNFVSSVLPIAGDLVKDLGYTPQDQDTVYTWNIATQGYDTVQYIAGAGWTSSDGSAPQIAIGQGLIIQAGQGVADTTWTQTLPPSN